MSSSQMTNIKIVFLICILNVSYTFPHIIKKKDRPQEIDIYKIEKYLVSIQEGSSDPQHICTGTILTERWILTAAKCIEENNFQTESEPTLNFYIFYPKNVDSSLVPVEEINIHVEYPDVETTISDIALLKTTYSIYTNYQHNVYDELNTEVQDETVKIMSTNIFNYEHPHFLNINCYGNAWINLGEDERSNRVLELKIWPVYLRQVDECNPNLSHTAAFQRNCYPSKEKIDIEFKDKIGAKDSRDFLGAALICDYVQLAVASLEKSDCDNPNKWLRIDTLYYWIQSILGKESSSKVLLYRSDQIQDGIYRDYSSGKITTSGIISITVCVLIGLLLIGVITYSTIIFIRTYRTESFRRQNIDRLRDSRIQSRNSNCSASSACS